MICCEPCDVGTGRSMLVPKEENNGGLESSEGHNLQETENTETTSRDSEEKNEKLRVALGDDQEVSPAEIESADTVISNSSSESVKGSTETEVDPSKSDATSVLYIGSSDAVSQPSPLQSEYNTDAKAYGSKGHDVDKLTESLKLYDSNAVSNQSGVEESDVLGSRAKVNNDSIAESVSTVVSARPDPDAISNDKDQLPKENTDDLKLKRISDSVTKPPDSASVDVQQIENSLEGEAMPSFDEWKQKEQEKSKSVDDNALSPATVPKSKTQSKKSINFASATCGAKILAANPEAQNSVFVLMENRDMYMINPCKARKVFTVELCEPVQVQSIEIGNLELFSSLPQSIEVNISDRYPTKEWKILGTFEARDERTIQVFQVEDSTIFSKYMRIEILSHYGTEHYCPISILRVFGLALDEEDDEDQSTGTQEVIEDDSLARETASNVNPTNLFSTATDTVLSLVKTVLNPKNEAGEPEKVSDVLSEVESLSSECSTDACRTRTQSMIEGQEDTPEVVGRGLFLSTVNRILQEGKEEVSPCEDGTNCHSEQTGNKACQEQEKPVVILVQTPDIPIYEILDECKVCDNGHNDTCLAGLCGYYQIASAKKKLSCLDAIHMSEEEKEVLAGGPPPCDDGHVKHGTLYVVEDTTQIPLSLNNLTLNSEDMDLSSPMKHLPSELTNKSSKLSPADRYPVDTNLDKTAPSVVHIKTVSEDVKLSDEAETPVVPPAQAIIDDHGSSSSSGSVNGGRKVIYPDSSSKFDTPVYDLDNTGGLDDIAYQKLARAGKETQFGKLKNRIRTLELNLNLTNRYLEELSRRYKRQMEEMYTSLNRTITRLSNTAKIAEDKELQQLEQIMFLESKLANLTAVVDMVENRIESVNSQSQDSNFTYFVRRLSKCTKHHDHKLKLVERHLLLMAFELFIFIFVIMFITKRPPAPLVNIKPPSNLKPNIINSIVSTTSSRAVEDVVSSLHDVALSTSTPSKVNVVRRRSDSSHLKSNWPRNSASRSTEYSIVKSGSENDLSAIEHNIPIFLTTTIKGVLPSEYHKKQRKKKKGQVKISSAFSRPAGEKLRTSVSSSALVCNDDANNVLDAANAFEVPRDSRETFSRHCRVRSLPIEDLSRNDHGSSTCVNGGPPVNNGAPGIIKSQRSMPAIVQSTNNKQLLSFDFGAASIISDERCLTNGGDRHFDASQQTIKLACQ